MPRSLAKPPKILAPPRPSKPKSASKKASPRRRRSSLEARAAILDAAERRLVASGPAGIRLQEVAADVGVSHPTVLHHFGSREGLIEAVVARALESLKTGLLNAMRTPHGPPMVAPLLENVFDTLVRGGHARAFLWLALSGRVPLIEELHVRSVAEAVHVVRREKRKGKKRMPPFEDTYFTVLLPALALISLSVIGPTQEQDQDAAPFGAARFRTWLAELVRSHLESA